MFHDVSLLRLTPYLSSSLSFCSCSKWRKNCIRVSLYLAGFVYYQWFFFFFPSYCELCFVRLKKEYICFKILCIRFNISLNILLFSFSCRLILIYRNLLLILSELNMYAYQSKQQKSLSSQEAPVISLTHINIVKARPLPVWKLPHCITQKVYLHCLAQAWGHGLCCHWQWCTSTQCCESLCFVRPGQWDLSAS